MSRFVRKQRPPVSQNHESYRPFLRIDFLERCAYCERNEAYLGGQDFFTVDHFWPRSKFPGLAFHYPNLYYTCGKCNQHKGSTWPNEKLQEDGFRFSDPCEEDLYLEHVREQSNGRLVPLDNCGEYTERHIRLNRPDLVAWRVLKQEMLRELGTLEEIRDMLQNRVGTVTSDAERERILTEVTRLERIASRNRAIIGLPHV